MPRGDDGSPPKRTWKNSNHHANPPLAFSTPILPWSDLRRRLQAQAFRHEQTFEQLEQSLYEQSQQRRRNGSLQDQPDVIEPDAGEDRLAVAAGADQRAERGRPHVDDR